MFTDAREIKLLMSDTVEVSWVDVYKIYSDSEKEKWLRIHGQAKTFRHFRYAKSTIREKTWYKGRIEVGDLYPATMSLNCWWIQELACPKHRSYRCPHCANTNPTLQKVVNNFALNANCKVMPKIRSLQKRYHRGELDVFTIVIEENIPYVFDGNSRLVSIATLGDNDEVEIKCYLGVKRQTGVGVKFRELLSKFKFFMFSARHPRHPE